MSKGNCFGIPGRATRGGTMMVGERNRPAFLDTPEGVAAVKAAKQRKKAESAEALTTLVEEKVE